MKRSMVRITFYASNFNKKGRMNVTLRGIKIVQPGGYSFDILGV